MAFGLISVYCLFCQELVSTQAPIAPQSVELETPLASYMEVVSFKQSPSTSQQQPLQNDIAQPAEPRKSESVDLLLVTAFISFNASLV
jgi:hypothetical protein